MDDRRTDDPAAYVGALEDAARGLREGIERVDRELAAEVARIYERYEHR